MLGLKGFVAAVLGGLGGGAARLPVASFSALPKP